MAQSKGKDRYLDKADIHIAGDKAKILRGNAAAGAVMRCGGWNKGRIGPVMGKG